MKRDGNHVDQEAGNHGVTDYAVTLGIMMGVTLLLRDIPNEKFPLIQDRGLWSLAVIFALTGAYSWIIKIKRSQQK